MVIYHILHTSAKDIQLLSYCLCTVYSTLPWLRHPLLGETGGLAAAKITCLNLHHSWFTRTVFLIQHFQNRPLKMALLESLRNVQQGDAFVERVEGGLWEWERFQVQFSRCAERQPHIVGAIKWGRWHQRNKEHQHLNPHTCTLTNSALQAKPFQVHSKSYIFNFATVTKKQTQRSEPHLCLSHKGTGPLVMGEKGKNTHICFGS